VGTDLHRPTAGRPRAGQTRAARFVGARDRTLRRSPPGRRGARARARKQGAIHGELDGGALTHRRARTPASKPRRRRFSLSSAVAMAVASAPWLPPRSVEREGGGENDARVWGAATATRFCSGENRGRPSDPNQRPRERLAFWAGKRPRRAGEGTPRRAVSAAWPLAVGPRAQGRVAEQAAGRFCSLAAEQCYSFYCFFYFSRSNFNSFLNEFVYSLISIQFCTNVYIV